MSTAWRLVGKLLSRGRAHFGDHADQSEPARRGRRLIADVERADRQLAALVDMRAAGELTSAEYHAARSRALEAKHRGEVELSRLPAPMDDARLTSAVKALSLLVEAWKVEDVTTKRGVLAVLGLSVTREAHGVRMLIAHEFEPFTTRDNYLPFTGPPVRVTGLPGRLIIPDVSERT